jgi:hypothetical protein
VTECTCLPLGGSYESYEGPQRDCPEHGALTGFEPDFRVIDGEINADGVRVIKKVHLIGGSISMVGKLVRWERDGKWFTARVTGRHVALPAWYGEVVDPGTFTLWRDGVVRPWAIGEVAPNLRDQFLTVMEESGPGAQP